MLKRLIHPENYDAQMPAHHPQRHAPAIFKNLFFRKRLKNIHLISIFMSFLTLIVLVYAVVEMGSHFQVLKKDLLTGQTHIKKMHGLLHETMLIKQVSQKISDKNLQTIEVMEHPLHLKYMGVFKSGNLQKALIETDQGGVLFALEQMVDQNWRLRKIFEDYLVLEAVSGQQVTIYKERPNE